MKKFIVITSIYPPTEAVIQYSRIKGWQLIVVADLKTPKDWACENVIFLSVEDQKKMGNSFVDSLPYNSYARKMVGYLYAIQNGADIIVDTDDDNIPYDTWGKDINFSGKFVGVSGCDFYNVYTHYTPEHIWPRGFPLEKILTNEPQPKFNKKQFEIGVIQYLADSDPDVDAIYRLTSNKQVFFEKKGILVLNNPTICPFNSQNTVFIRDTFPLMFLPAYVNFRFTDILRGYVAQPVMWSGGYSLAFSDATVIQKRNEHNYLNDFISEIPCFLHPAEIVRGIVPCTSPSSSITGNLLNIYKKLLEMKIVTTNEVDLLSKWIQIF